MDVDTAGGTQVVGGGRREGLRTATATALSAATAAAVAAALAVAAPAASAFFPPYPSDGSCFLAAPFWN